MPSVIEQRDGTVEREMTAHQRGLVDTCLEEGQFESAIGLMEQLRSPQYKPPISHIQQLIYIALQPVSSPPANELPSRDVTTPDKKTAMKNRRLTGAAVEAAQRLLMSLALTNLPETIARGLPCCDAPWNTESDNVGGSSESVIGAEAACIGKAKSCWNILTEGFTQRHQYIPSVQDKGKKRPYDLDERFDQDSFTTETAAVGENAWPVLDWLLVLFDQDELCSTNRGSGCYSTLLLQQIPCPRSGNGKRWDAEAPLRVIFYCLEQSYTERRMMGFRLMTLLINLSSASFLDLPLFSASVYSKLISAAELDKLPTLLSGLSPSPPTHEFKITLCMKFLSDFDPSNRLPKPQIRAQPRALPPGKTESLNDQTGSISKTQPSQSEFSLPSFVEIKRLMEAMPSPSSPLLIGTSLVGRIKFELINSYGMLQNEASPSVKDKTWLASLRNGELTETLNMAFGSEGGGGENAMFRELLGAIATIWS